MVLDFALRYADLGYPVLPLEPGGKAPCAALVPRGLKEATRDPAVLEAWWRQVPGANLGILPPEGVLVLDVDEPGVLEALPLPETAPLHRTPSGGAHVFLRLPEGLELPARVRALPGVDLRGMGRAYVAAPPSWTFQGSYRAERPLAPVEALPEAPGALVERLLEAVTRDEVLPAAVSEGARASPARLFGLLRWAAERVRSAPVGSRHDTLLRYARLLGGYLHLGLSREEALEALVQAALEAGLPWKEAARTASWGLEAGRARPLSLPDRALEEALRAHARFRAAALDVVTRR